MHFFRYSGTAIEYGNHFLGAQSETKKHVDCFAALHAQVFDGMFDTRLHGALFCGNAARLRCAKARITGKGRVCGQVIAGSQEDIERDVQVTAAQFEFDPQPCAFFVAQLFALFVGTEQPR